MAKNWLSSGIHERSRLRGHEEEKEKDKALPESISFIEHGFA